MKPAAPTFAAFVLATLSWSLGISAAFAPLAASAAASGTLVRASTAAIYYVGADGKRYVFPNEKTYRTWYADFGAVLTITDAQLAALPIGGNVTYKPGVRMVKITSDPKVYAVDRNGALRWVKTEAAARQLFGTDWNRYVDDVPDAFFVNYMLGSDIISDADYDAQSVRTVSASINVDKGLLAPGTPPSGAATGGSASGGNALLSMSLPATPAPQTFVQGTHDAPLFGVTLSASTGEVAIGGITLTCYVDGNLDSSFKQGQDDAGETKRCTDILPSVTLRNGDSILGTTSPTTSASPGSGGIIQFSGLDLRIPAGQSKTLSVSAGLAGVIASLNDRVQLRVAAASDVIGRNAAGNAVSPTGAPLIGPTMTITPNGTGAADKAPIDDDSREGTVVAGSPQAVLAKFRLTAQSEDLKLVKARIRVAPSSVAAVLSLSLYDGDDRVGGPVPVDQAGRADFAGMSVAVPKNGSKTVTVKAALNAVGPSGAATGTNVAATLDDGDDGMGSANGTFELRGASAGSSTVITHLGSLAADDSLAGETKIIRKTRPTVSLAPLPGTALVNGSTPIFRFTVSADAAEQISLKKLAFQANVSDRGGSPLSLAASGANSGIREVGQGSNAAGQTDFAGCSGSGTCIIKVSFDDEQVIASGFSKTYDLRVNVLGADKPGESLSTSLLGDAAD
ncbi:MAG: hypothetical protein RL272_278, partial [Candidatus Parcubacteria bacterium]